MIVGRRDADAKAMGRQAPPRPVTHALGHTYLIRRQILPAAKAALSGQLPRRYEFSAVEHFRALLKSTLKPGMRILDVGAGRRPAILPDARPPGTFYVGLDISEAELGEASTGSYDQVIVTDITRPHPALNEQFDLIVSFYALEHVKPLDDAFANMRAYLRPKGRLVAVLAGTFAGFALIHRLMPHRVGSWIQKRLYNRPPESTFPAYYHHCWYSRLERILKLWDRAEIAPYYTAASYFRFSRYVQAFFIGYEEWTYQRNHRNLASHYLVTAVA
jgi:SAM-dependent methyltransferase